MRLTREQFLAGVEFHVPGRDKVTYQFVATRNDITAQNPGYIREIGLVAPSSFHCDVLNVDAEALFTYTFMLGQMFSHTYMLSDFVVAEKKVSEKLAS